MRDNDMEVHQRNRDHRALTLVDMGEATLTGGRLRRVAEATSAAKRRSFHLW